MQDCTGSNVDHSKGPEHDQLRNQAVILMSLDCHDDQPQGDAVSKTWKVENYTMQDPVIG